MSARVSDYKNSLYHREYANDVPQQQNIIARTALAAVPFLGLHSSLRWPVGIGMGSLRVWNAWQAKDLSQAALGVVALASTVFSSRVGQVVTTIHDILLEIKKLTECKTKGEALHSLLKILNQLLYIALITHGGLELSIVSFALQAVLELIQSVNEYQGGRWIELVAHLAMAVVRLQQTYGQCQQLKRNWEIEAAVKQFYVGKLGEKWQFPSDHLPVGVEVNGVRIISWNVLNGEYMQWVTEKDGQGLNGSLITALHKPVGSDGLTVRDVLVADMVQQMMSRGDVIALQECSNPFLHCLQERLLPGWKVVTDSPSGYEKDHLAVLYNENRMHFSSSETSRSVYPSDPGRPVFNTLFSDAQGHSLQIMNAHIPGDPNKPGREEFARYVFAQHRDDGTTVALGDNNFERQQMIDAYRKAGFSDFSLHSPWQTNIDPYSKQSKGIDHLFVVGEHSSRDLRVDEVLQQGKLEETIGLLRNSIG